MEKYQGVLARESMGAVKQIVDSSKEMPAKNISA
jgi:hypothetical protein